MCVCVSGVLSATSEEDECDASEGHQSCGYDRRWITVASGAGQGARRRGIDAKAVVVARSAGDRCGTGRRRCRCRWCRGRVAGVVGGVVSGVVGGMVGGIVWLFSVHRTMASNGMVPMSNGKVVITTSRTVRVCRVDVAGATREPESGLGHFVDGHLHAARHGFGFGADDPVEVAVPAPAVGCVRLAGGVAGSDGSASRTPVRR